MIELDVNALLNGEIRQVSKYGGSEGMCRWQCEDNYLVGYSTTRISHSRNGKYDGKFACVVWKPDSKKDPKIWKIVYYRAFSQRKLARKYAEKHYYLHSPKRAAKHGVKI